ATVDVAQHVFDVEVGSTRSSAPEVADKLGRAAPLTFQRLDGGTLDDTLHEGSGVGEVEWHGGTGAGQDDDLCLGQVVRDPHRVPPRMLSLARRSSRDAPRLPAGHYLRTRAVGRDLPTALRSSHRPPGAGEPSIPWLLLAVRGPPRSPRI